MADDLRFEGVRIVTRAEPKGRLTHAEKKARLDKAVALAQEIGVEAAANDVGLSPRYIYLVCRERMIDVFQSAPPRGGR